jgi:3-oxoadipate enol-lactonase
MPYAAVNGTELHYRIDGDRHGNAPWIVLSNSLGSDLSMWTPQVAALSKHFRVLRYDTRGHGHSEAPKGPYTIEQLTGDVLGLMDTRVRISAGCRWAASPASRWPRVTRIVSSASC